MNRRRYNVCCGADIHKTFLIATILLLDGTKLTKRFSMDLRSLFEFRDWVNANGCEVVAAESTGSYWVPIYRVLEGHVELIVANAYRIKNVPGRKTDTIDSEWIAELCLNGLDQAFKDISEGCPRSEKSNESKRALRRRQDQGEEQDSSHPRFEL